MKKYIIIQFAIVGLLLIGCNKKTEEIEKKGSIYGTVTDFATGEPVKNATVKLPQIGETTLTGSDGMYDFLDITNGTYSINVSQSEYKDLIDTLEIVVSDGRRVKRDVKLEKLPSVLRIINSNGEDISDLPFGAENDVTSRTFSIFNDSPRKITWWIEENCSWITEAISMLNHESSGEIEAGEQEPIKVTIDRNALGLGVKSYILNINSDNGSKELLITAGADAGLPSLTTEPVSNISQNSATFHGTIINAGSPPYNERGFVYSTNPQPTIENNVGQLLSPVNSQQSFSANVTGLNPNLTYYVRAYAINTIDIAYGDNVYFNTSCAPTELVTSAVTDIGITSATLNATINSVGIPTYTERGFCYNTATDPTISNNKVVDSGLGTGNYSCNIEGLEYQTSYYVRAYAMQNGQPIYGKNVNFSTSWTAVQLNTIVVTNISASNATLHGEIINVGSPELSEKGFCYSSIGEPSITDNKVIVAGNSVGEYSCNISNLDYVTTYYVRAYAIQNGQPIYGNMVSFETIWVNAEVQTSVTNIDVHSARFNGFISFEGIPACTEKGFCYDDMTTMPTIDNNKIVVYGSFSRDITNLNSGTTYYVRTYVMQNNIPVYGNVVAFTTATPPVVITNEVTNIVSGSIMDNYATFNGQIEFAGSPPYIERGFCYSSYTTPTINHEHITAPGSGTGPYSVVCHGLVLYSTYYVCAYAKTPSGTYIYGEVVSFTIGGL